MELNDSLKSARDKARSARRSIKRKFAEGATGGGEKPSDRELAEADALDAAALQAETALRAALHEWTGGARRACA
ncbi:hypothetical protein V4F39_05545 [Aquincola sp. MAHUQ-54]|uniref:Uncharacterized protein n=1 Tax=Aquincola agrisoli TaxID=3119538 RepID=A0AAW9QD85_9BURK